MVKPSKSLRSKSVRLPGFEILERRRLLAFGIAYVTADLAEGNRLSLFDTATVDFATGTLAEAGRPFHYGFTKGSDDTEDNINGPRGIDDVVIAGDWRGNGYTSAGVARQRGTELVFLLDTDRDKTHEYDFRFGNATDTPVVGNFDGTHGDDIAVAKLDSDKFHWQVVTADATDPYPRDDRVLTAVYSFQFGNKADFLRTGHFDSDQRADLVAVSPNVSQLKWSIYTSSNQAYPSDNRELQSEIDFTFGEWDPLKKPKGLIPIVGDWNNDGHSDIGYVDTNTTPHATWTFRTLKKGTFDKDQEIEIAFGGYQNDQVNTYLVGNWTGNYFHGNNLSITGPTAGTRWSDAVNWSEQRVPVNEVAIIEQPPGFTVDFSQPDSQETLQYSGTLLTPNALSLTGGTLQLSGASRVGDITMSGGVLEPLASEALGKGTLRLTGGTLRSSTPQSVSSTIRLSNSIELSNTVTIETRNDSYLVLGSITRGSGQIDKTGSGFLLVPNGAGNYAGKVNVSAGELTIEGSSQISDIEVKGGALVLDDFRGPASNLNVVGGGLALRNDIQFQNVTIDSGEHVISRPIAAQSIVVNNASLQIQYAIATNPLGTASLTLNNASLLTSIGPGISGEIAQFRLPNSIELVGQSRVGNTDAVQSTSGQNYVILSGIISGDGGLTKVGRGTVQLLGANTYQGRTIIELGEIRADHPSALGAITAGTEIMTPADPSDTAAQPRLGLVGITSAENISVAAGARLDLRQSAIAAGDLTLSSNANVLFENEVQITGNVRIESGNVTPLQPVSIDTTEQLDQPLRREPARISGRITGNGILILRTQRDHAITLTNSSNSFAGETRLLGNGTVLLGNDSALSSTLNVASAATLSLNGFSQTIGSLTGAGNVNLADGTLTVESGEFAGKISGGGRVQKDTQGQLILSGANDFTTPLNILRGTLLAGATNTLPSVTVDLTLGATLDLQTFDQRIANLTGDGTVRATSATLIVDSAGPATFSGRITGDLALTKRGSGSLTLANTNSYTRETKIEAGSITFRATGSLGSGPLSVDLNATANLQGDQTFSGLTNAGTVSLSDTQTISQLNNSGTITANTATMRLTGNLTNTGTLTLGTLITSGSGPALQEVQLGTATLSNLTTSGAATVELTSADDSLNLTGNLIVQGPLDLRAMTLTTGGLVLNAPSDTSVRGTGSITSRATYDLQSGTIALSLMGASGARKSGSGTVTINVPLTNLGPTTIDQGTLLVAASGSLGSGTVTINAPGTIQLQGSQAISQLTSAGTVAANNATLRLANNLTNTGTLTLGSLITTGSGAAPQVVQLGSATLSHLTTTGTAPVQLSTANNALDLSGSLTVQGPLDLGSVNLAAAGFVLNAPGDTILRGTGSVTSSTAFDVRSGQVDVRLIGSNGLIKRDATTVTLNATNDVSGDVVVEAGRLRAGARDALGGAVSTRALASLELTSDQSLVSLENAGTLIANSSTVQLTGNFNNTGNFLAGSSALNLVGTINQSVATGNSALHNIRIAGIGNRVTLSSGRPNQTLTGSLNLESGDLETGALDINTSQFVLDSSTESTIRGTGRLTSATVFDLRGGIVAIELAGTSGLRKSSSRSVRIDVPTTHSGTTNVIEGSLQVNTAGAISHQSPIVISREGQLQLGDFRSALHSITNAGSVLVGEAELSIIQNLSNESGATFQTGRAVIELGGNLINRGSWSSPDTTLQWIGTGQSQALVSGGAVFAAMNKPSLNELILQDQANVTATYTHSGGELNLSGGALRAGSLDWDAGLLTTNSQGPRFGIQLRDSATFLSGQFNAPVIGGSIWTKAGAGQLVLADQLDYLQRFDVLQGEVQVTDEAALPAQRDIRIAEAAEVNLHSGEASFANIEVSGRLMIAAAPLLVHPIVRAADAASPFATVTGSISGTQGFTKLGRGPLLWTGMNAIEGPYRIEAGEFIVASDTALATKSTLTIATAGSVHIDQARVSNLQIDGEGQLHLTATGQLRTNGGRFHGVLQGSGIIDKVTDHILQFGPSSHGEFSGQLAIAAGQLVVDGSLPAAQVTINDRASLAGNGALGVTTIASGGWLSPGNSPGALRLESLDLQSGATLLVELDGRQAGNLYDQLVVTNLVQLNGNVLVRPGEALRQSFTPDDYFDIVTFAAMVGLPTMVVENGAVTFIVQPLQLPTSYRLIIQIPTPPPIIQPPDTVDGPNDGGSNVGSPPQGNMLISAPHQAQQPDEVNVGSRSDEDAITPDAASWLDRSDSPLPPTQESAVDTEVVAAAVDSALSDTLGLGIATLATDMKPLTSQELERLSLPETRTLDSVDDGPKRKAPQAIGRQSALWLGSGLTLTMLGLVTMWQAYRGLIRARLKSSHAQQMVTTSLSLSRSIGTRIDLAGGHPIQEDNPWRID